MIVHLVDGTYELFRHFYGLRRFSKGEDRPYGAVVGVPGVRPQAEVGPLAGRPSLVCGRRCQ